MTSTSGITEFQILRVEHKLITDQSIYELTSAGGQDQAWMNAYISGAHDMADALITELLCPEESND